MLKKLTINKETVANLNNFEMKVLKAGNYPTLSCLVCTTSDRCSYGCFTAIEFYCNTEGLDCTEPYTYTEIGCQ